MTKKTTIEKLNAIRALADLLIAKVEAGETEGTSDLYNSMFDGVDALETVFLA